MRITIQGILTIFTYQNTFKHKVVYGELDWYSNIDAKKKLKSEIWIQIRGIPYNKDFSLNVMLWKIGMIWHWEEECILAHIIYFFDLLSKVQKLNEIHRS